ncbi:MAG: toprim domain-containing protein [Lactobacillaceae bacterium]|jgi:hypothetical protein|nr:toprim domain-containing protein [Lactobacillaceae bacterium]
MANKTDDFTKQKVSLQEYLEYVGESWGKVDRSGWAKLDSHDSLYVNLDDNRFAWHAHSLGGNLFNYMKEVDGIEEYKDRLSTLHKIQIDRTGAYKQIMHERGPKEQFDVNKHELADLSDQSKKFLTDVRGIDPGIVNALARGGLLRDEVKTVQSKNSNHSFESRNIWYPWRDSDGIMVGANAQATHKSKKITKHDGYWKGNVLGSPSDQAGFNFRVGPKKETPDKLIIFEASLDAISYWQLHFAEIHNSKENVQFFAMSGVGNGAAVWKFMHDHYFDEEQDTGWHLPAEVHFAVDNDQPGRDMIHKFTDTFSNINLFDDTKMMVDVPSDIRTKDWNDQLRYGDTLETLSVSLNKLDELPLYIEPVKVEVIQPKQIQNTVTKQIDQNVSNDPSVVKIPEIIKAEMTPEQKQQREAEKRVVQHSRPVPTQKFTAESIENYEPQNNSVEQPQTAPEMVF